MKSAACCAAVAIVAAALALASATRAGLYADSVELWRSDVATFPQHRVHLQLARELASIGDSEHSAQRRSALRKRAEYYERVLPLTMYPERLFAQMEVGAACATIGDVDKAEQMSRAVLEESRTAERLSVLVAAGKKYARAHRGNPWYEGAARFFDDVAKRAEAKLRAMERSP